MNQANPSPESYTKDAQTTPNIDIELAASTWFATMPAWFIPMWLAEVDDTTIGEGE